VNWLHQKISIVEKEPIFFNGTIKENICCGLERNVSDEELEYVYKMVNVHDKIKSLKNGGYDFTLEPYSSTKYDKSLLQGTALARALIRDQKIVLLHLV